MQRIQRLKKNSIIRDLTNELNFSKNNLIQPLFIVEGLTRSEDVPGLRGTQRLAVKELTKVVDADLEAGVRSFMCFFVPQHKAHSGFSSDFMQETLKQLRVQVGHDAWLWVDICLCSRTETGHCCLFNDQREIDHDKTLNELGALATAAASAGADGVAPSDMMDGRTGHIRNVLDRAKLETTPIMSYSSKFSSAFYGPFRVAASSAPQFGDRASYQLDVRNRSEAIAASRRCAEEGADLLMVKPGMTSLDLIQPIAEQTGRPVGAYQVSGEYASLHLLDKEGLMNFERGLLESWHVLRRGGARYIITYGARYAKALGL
jgi:porphobilinogen synthase